MASTYMAVNMERHLSLYFLPLCHHFISVQFVGPSLQLQENLSPFLSFSSLILLRKGSTKSCNSVNPLFLPFILSRNSDPVDLKVKSCASSHKVPPPLVLLQFKIPA
jgi:hypothetical protein